MVFKTVVSGKDFKNPKIMQKVEIKKYGITDSNRETLVSECKLLTTELRYTVGFQQQGGCRRLPFLTSHKRKCWQTHENKTSEIRTVFHGNDYEKGQIWKQTEIE